MGLDTKLLAASIPGISTCARSGAAASKPSLGAGRGDPAAQLCLRAAAAHRCSAQAGATHPAVGLDCAACCARWRHVLFKVPNQLGLLQQGTAGRGQGDAGEQGRRWGEGHICTWRTGVAQPRETGGGAASLHTAKLQRAAFLLRQAHAPHTFLLPLPPAGLLLLPKPEPAVTATSRRCCRACRCAVAACCPGRAVRAMPSALMLLAATPREAGSVAKRALSGERLGARSVGRLNKRWPYLCRCAIEGLHGARVVKHQAAAATWRRQACIRRTLRGGGTCCAWPDRIDSPAIPVMASLLHMQSQLPVRRPHLRPRQCSGAAAAAAAAAVP